MLRPYSNGSIHTLILEHLLYTALP